MSIKNYISSSIGKKQIVAITGLLVVGFIFFHMVMNLLYYAGPEVYNVLPKAAHKSGIVLKIVELGLAAIFITHIAFTAIVTVENIKARGPRKYAEFKGKKKRSLATRLMPVTGTVLLLFIITHLIDFWWPDHYGPATIVNGVEQGTYGLIHNEFKNGFNVIWYILALFAIGLHLAHGVQSMLQTFGIKENTTQTLIDRISTTTGLLIAAGFSSIPLYVYFCG